MNVILFSPTLYPPESGPERELKRKHSGWFAEFRGPLPARRVGVSAFDKT